MDNSAEDIRWKTETSLYEALIHAKLLEKPMLNYFIEMALVEFEDTFKDDTYESKVKKRSKHSNHSNK